MVDYQHPRRRQPSVPPVPPGPAPTGPPPTAAPGSIDYSHRLRRRTVDYRHPRRLPQGAVPDSTRGGVSGQGWQLYTLGNGEIVRFDPDKPIGVRVNLDQAGRGAMDDIAQALWFVTQATGLGFVLDEMTARIPQAADYGRSDPRRPTLTIAWAKPGPVPGGSDLLDAEELRRSVPEDRPEASQGIAVGVGGWHVERVTGDDGLSREAITTAMVVIDSTVRELFPPGFGNGSCRGAVLLHEIAHACGLGHVDDPAQLMYPVVTEKLAAFGAGDLEALKRVGQAAGPIPALRAHS